ncbi:MAG: hypothetical protein QM796_21430 [Chthoniobacteraceae bacterium]
MRLGISEKELPSAWRGVVLRCLFAFMHRISSYAAAYVLLCLFAQPAAARDEDDSLGNMFRIFRPSQVIQEVPPIQVPADDSRSQAGWTQRHNLWLERLLLADFTKRHAGSPWLQDATEVLRDAVPFMTGRVSPERKVGASASGRVIPHPDTMQKIKAAEKAGCSDPLFIFVSSYLDLYFKNPTKELADKIEQLLPEFLRGNDSAHLKLFVGAWVYGEQNKYPAASTKEKNAEREKMVVLLLSAALDASVTPDDSLGFFCLSRRTAAFGYLEWKRQQSIPLIEKSSAALWLKGTILGNWEIDAAWKDRGSGWADTVSEKGWEGFATHLKLARKHLVDAYHDNPDVPFAAADMITVTMAGYGVEGMNERVWFDRAIAACFDYEPAYTKLSWAYRPRWGGSHELMMAFGRACARTARFDTKVPFHFYEVAEDIAAEAEQPIATFYNAKNRALVAELEAGRLQKSKTDAEKLDARALSLPYLYAAQEYEEAAKLYEILKPLPARTERVMSILGFLSVEWQGNLTIRKNTEATQLFELAEAAFRKGNLPLAKESYQALAALPMVQQTTESIALVRHRLLAIGVEERFASGSWIQLTPEEHQSLWVADRLPEWKAEEGGVLTVKCEAADLYPRVILNARLGLEFELKASLANTGQARPQFGCVIGFRPGYSGFATVTCGQTTDNKQVTQASLAKFSKDTGKKYVSYPASLKPDSRIHIRCQQGKVTLWVDDKEVYTEDLNSRFDKRQPTPASDAWQHLIGFGANHFIKGESRLRDIQFRKL